MTEFVPKFNLKSIKNDRDLRKVRLKLDCPSEMVWDKWKPSQEHPKTFYIKNILNKVQMLRWVEPDTPYFNTNFQEPHARLNPGMTAAIVIFFRPESVEDYFSSIVFRTARGSFTLQLRGLLPSVNLGLPEHIDYKYCPVKDVTTKTFDIHNDQDFIVGFKWLSVTHPFSITPTQGNLRPGQVMTMSCHFCPDNATAYKGVVRNMFVSPEVFSLLAVVCLCKANVGTTTKTKGQVKLFGIGKYSFLALSTPVLDFEAVLTRTSKEMEQIVTNLSPVIARFAVHRVEAWYNGHDSVYTISPMEGAIPPNSALSLKVLYHPVVAGTFSLEQFEIFTSQARRASFACSGTAARPVIKFTVPFMDFGNVECGSSSHRTVTLENLSAASVAFQFVTDDLPIFEFLQTRGICRANRSVLIHCHFRPCRSMNYYKRVLVLLQDQYPLFVDVMGTGYKVALRSATILPYHIYDHRESLKLIRAEREMASLLLLSDIPQLPAIEGGDGYEPMYTDPVDLFYGQPTDDTQDDPPEWSWVERPNFVHSRLPGGSSMGSPGQSSGALANMLLTAQPEERQAFSDAQNLEIQVKDRSAGLVMLHRQQASGRISASECWEEYYMGRMVDWDPVSVDHAFLEFGHGQKLVESPVQIVYVKNNLADDVTIMWLPPWEFEQPHVALSRARIAASKLPPAKTKPEPEPLCNVFLVDPEMTVIAPGMSVPFSFMFRPTQDDMYFLQMLSCFVWTKTSYHVVPNWSTAVQASGHSFHDKTHVFMPLASLSRHKVVFPPAVKGTTVYESIMIYNHDANTPTRYHFMSEHLPGEFQMKPSHGLVPPKDFNIITFRFEAGEPKLSVGHVVCTLNNSPAETMQVNLTASSHIPKVRLERMDKALCFKPTSIGTQAMLSLVLVNMSSIPANFDWQVPQTFAKVFIIQPAYGLLRAGERMAIEFSFFPQAEKLYYCKIPCLYAACLEKAFVQENTHLIEGVTSNDVSRFLLIVNGAGILQTISITPQHLDYKTVVTGFPYKQTFVLFNPSVGSLRFLLEKNPGKLPVKDDSNHLVLDCERGILPGGLTKTIFVTLHPLQVQSYDFVITCKTFLPPLALNFEDATFQKLSELGGHETQYDESEEAVESITSCSMSMEAIHPTLYIASGRTHGMSAAQLFRMGLLRHWNRELQEGKIVLRPNGRVVYQELFCLGAPVGDSPHDFLLNFEVREIGARSSIIYLALKTGTPLSVSWRFRLWNDIEIDSENWVMELDASEDEEKALLMRSLFQIEPRKGHLEPGEIAFVKLSYCHRIEGSHKFPAILEITDGRTVHIYLNGRTVANPIRILTYRPDTHFLKSMVVGDADPPLQTTELINRGQFELQYNLDMTPLIAMQKSNYGFRVLWCLNPQGVIPPMESVLILWLFQPLEAKTYSVEIPVHLKDGEGGILILRGSGRLPTDAQDPNSTDGEPPRHPGTTYNWPGTPAVLTSELLDYGTVNELSVNHKLIGVQNLLTENPVAFRWRHSVGADKMVYGQFTVEPQSGVIDQGRRILCKVSFLAGVQPQLFETTLYCEISVLSEDPLHSFAESSTSSDTGSEIIVDTWPRELGFGTYNKEFEHKSALTLSTVCSRSKITDFALQKSAGNPYLHFLARMDTQEIHTPPATCFILYVTVVAHIRIKQYHPTSEDLFAVDNRLPWEPQERSDIEIQTELVNGILLEILQESLHDESHNASFDNLDSDCIMQFEEFQREHPTPLTEEQEFSQLFMNLGDGELPPLLPGSNKELTPETCHASIIGKPLIHELADGNQAGSSSEQKTIRTAAPQVPRPSSVVRAIESSIGTKEAVKPEPPDHSSATAISETAELLLEDVLFTLTADLFEIG